MDASCKTPTGSRDWTKEEMMAYLDWSNAEDEHVFRQVKSEAQEGGLFASRRGVEEIWNAIERDSREQQARHTT